MKRLPLIIFIFTIVACPVLGFLSFYFANEANKITYIKNSDDFYKIYDNLNGYYVIESPDAISLDKPWKPIGTINHPFTGTIEGLGATIYIKGGYDNEYIFNSIKSGNLLLGLFGCNNGVIKHLRVFDNTNVQIETQEKGTSSLTFTYGTITAVNNGFVTSCRGDFPSVEVVDDGVLSNIGGIVGINRNQIMGCTFLSHFDVKCNGMLNAGCICGIMEENGIIKYCYRNGYSFFKLDYKKINSVGLLVGLCKGGLIENIALSSENRGVYFRFNGVGKESTITCGSLIGSVISNSNLKIDKIVCDASIDMQQFIKGEFGFVAGNIATNNYIVECSNCYFSGEIVGNVWVGRFDVGIIFPGYINGNDHVVVKNILYGSLNSNIEIKDKDYFDEVSFKDVSLAMIDLDSTIWRKGERFIYLEYVW